MWILTEAVQVCFCSSVLLQCLTWEFTL
uniref:Uncharacterized protein n=1 Tax=Anguilla anguilla TaxID=7936 RepID=A0A0E9TW52_ANGAN